jgi:peptidoglycan hydrolase-like protein with peptidoglycan-binding domain
VHKHWIGCLASNFSPGRSGFKPEAIVIHRSGGSLDDIDARFSQTRSFNSAHYAVGTEGEVHQYVEETDTAFHAGVVVNPAWRLLKAGSNPNFITIAIEHAGVAGDPVTELQYAATAALIAEILRTYQIFADADHVVLHSEIRAGRLCPGDGFDRGSLLDRVRAALSMPDGSTNSETEVLALTNANVREGAPSISARIVRVIRAGETEAAQGFTDRGERINGNSYWYRTQDNNYFWAGATAAPNPVAAENPHPVPASVPAILPAAAVRCGIQRIDQLFSGAPAAPPLGAGEADTAAVGAVQDLVSGHGYSGLPTMLSTSYGVFGTKTTQAISAFQNTQSLPATGVVDSASLRKLVTVPAIDPHGCEVYLSLALGFQCSGMQRILCLVAQMEGLGKFAALNRNTDRAGLSFGLIQWAQRPGRLAEILLAMSQADRDQFVEIFGAGEASLADSLIAHSRKFSGGVDPSTGITMNAAFDLIADPWLSRFRQAALVLKYQQTQVQIALAAFDASYERLRLFAPDLVSERGVGFMLDVANQFGDGGSEKLYKAVHHPGMQEMDLLSEIADATVARMDDSLKAGVRARRDRFLETRLLLDQPFAPNLDVQAAHS